MSIIQYNSVRNISKTISKTYDDISSHTFDVYQGDFLTSSHETTHQINSEIANGDGRHRSQAVGLYCLNDLAFLLDEPKFKIKDVAQLVPQNFRSGKTGLYQLYLIQQASSWGDRPLYLADEWVAYTNGSIVALELAQAGDKDVNRWSQIQNAIYFNMFIASLWQLCEDYSKKEELFNFIVFNLGRVHAIYETSMKCATLSRVETIQMMNLFYSHGFYKPFDGVMLPEYGFDY